MEGGIIIGTKALYVFLATHMVGAILWGSKVNTKVNNLESRAKEHDKKLEAITDIKENVSAIKTKMDNNADNINIIRDSVRDISKKL